MFTDLRGSTRYYREVGDAPAFGSVLRHLDVLRDAVAQTLDNMTLAELVNVSPQQEQRSAATQFIALSDIHMLSNMGFAAPPKAGEPVTGGA